MRASAIDLEREGGLLVSDWRERKRLRRSSGASFGWCWNEGSRDKSKKVRAQLTLRWLRPRERMQGQDAAWTCPSRLPSNLGAGRVN